MYSVQINHSDCGWNTVTTVDFEPNTNDLLHVLEDWCYRNNICPQDAVAKVVKSA